MSYLPPCVCIASALIMPPFLIIASDMSNPHSNNQHGIKICLFHLQSYVSNLFTFYAFQTLQTMSCTPCLKISAERRVGVDSVPMSNWWDWMNSFPISSGCSQSTFNPYSDNLVHRKHTLSSLWKRLGIVSVCKPYWISKLMILLVGGVSLRCSNAWKTPVYSFLGRHLPFFWGAITSELLLVMKLGSIYMITLMMSSTNG